MQVVIAGSWRLRLRGLALRRPDSWPVDRGLEFPHTRSVHTLGMRFPIDLIWLDAHRSPVRIDRAVPPTRLRSNRHARSVIECHAGHADDVVAYLRSSP
jgi:uncharacterized membrane protein (UPF0127 family)